MTEYAIETNSLTKIYRSAWGRRAGPAIESLDLQIRANEIFGFLGKNGAGKTTTIKTLCGLVRQTRGEAHILGVNTRLNESRRQVGYLPQDPFFYEYLTPRETLNFYGQLMGLTQHQREEEWENLATLFDLHGLATQRIREFSRGMRQRLGFAVALVGDPSVLILDEPMSGLDPLGRRSFRELILLLKERGRTIFFSSHVLGDVEQICDRVAILVDGKLGVQGRIDELLSRRVEHVEVILKGLSDPLIAELKNAAISWRESEAGDHFRFPDLRNANDMVRRCMDVGARLIEFIPVKESLEDYFMREQDGHF